MIDTWLQEATRNLSQADQKAIEKEIRCHFAEAVLHHQDHGHSLEEASRRALHDLGAPEDANREFRSVHYTPQESTIMSYWEAYGWIRPDDSRPVQLFKWLLACLLTVGLMQAIYVFFMEGRLGVEFAGPHMGSQTVWMVLILLISPIPWQNHFSRPQSFLISQYLAAFWVTITPWVWFEGQLWAILTFAGILGISFVLFAPVISKSLKMTRV